MRKRRNPALPVAFACASLALAQSSAEFQSPQRLVILNVAASNAQGEPVTDLRLSDLHVREDGKPQHIIFFRFAGSKRSIQPPEPGEFVNRPLSTPTVILFDRWNERSSTAAAAWIDLGGVLQRMESVDRVYIYFLTTNGDLYPVHPLPATDADLRTMPNPSPAELRVKLDDAVRKLQGFRHVDAQDLWLRANRTFVALNALGIQMASLTGRKNLIWVTHGLSLVTPLPDYWPGFTPQVRGLSAAAAEAQIAIYTVQESAAGPGADLGGGDKETLQVFSALTGGRWYPSDYADRAIADSIADGRGNYRVAYYSPFREKDHKGHKIRVDSERKGIHILSREGYFGDVVESSPDVIEDAEFARGRRSPFDAAEIGLRVRISRNSANRTMHFNIRVDAEDVLLERHDEKYQGRLTMMLAFYNEGFLHESMAPIPVDIDLTQEQFNKALTNGIVIAANAPVSDKVQKIRVMVFDRGLHGLGSVTFPASP